VHDSSEKNSSRWRFCRHFRPLDPRAYSVEPFTGPALRSVGWLACSDAPNRFEVVPVSRFARIHQPLTPRAAIPLSCTMARACRRHGLPAGLSLRCARRTRGGLRRGRHRRPGPSPDLQAFKPKVRGAGECGELQSSRRAPPLRNQDLSLPTGRMLGSGPTWTQRGRFCGTPRPARAHGRPGNPRLRRQTCP
jgi:hypothetical protein